VSANERLVIPFKGLKDGWHNFIYKIDNKFFELLEYSELKIGDLSLQINLNKNSNFLLFEYSIIGKISITCDRCLDYFDMKIENSGKFYIKFSKETEENDEGYLTISPNEDSVDITHYIYESIVLNLPGQRVHPLSINGKSTCNKEMLKKLKQFDNKKNRNKEIDSRWEKLNEINN
jgi:uncharacterized metal-binding protein YceD (DUF177 family)